MPVVICTTQNTWLLWKTQEKQVTIQHKKLPDMKLYFRKSHPHRVCKTDKQEKNSL